MWTASLFQVTTGQVGPELNFESISWSMELNGVESISIKLRKSDLPSGINLNYWLSPMWAGVLLRFQGVPIVAGPILARPTESFDTLSLTCGGIRSILAKRFVTKELQDWSQLNKSVVPYNGLALGTIAKRVVQQSMAKKAGPLPISFPVPDQGVTVIPKGLPACTVEDGSVGPNPCYWDAKKQGNGQGVSYAIIGDQVIYGSPGDHERNYRGFNLQNINCHDVLTKLSNVINGPDIMFKPRLLRDDRLTFDMWTGTDAQPRIYQRFTPVWDTTPTQGQVVEMSTITTGSYQTNRTYSLGAGQDEGLLIQVNTNDRPLQQQYPLLETVVNVGNSENANLVDSYGKASLETNEYPLLEVQMTVRADGEIPLGFFWPGDLVQVVTKGWLSLPDGVTQMRLLSITGNDSNSVKLSLQKEDKFV
jgi:hypothetical protein